VAGIVRVVARPNLSEQTRDEIVTAAIALLDGDGVGALSMRRLATVVGIRSPTLYHYFESKSALLDAVKEQIADEIWTSVEARLVDVDPSDWQAALRCYVEGAAAAMAKHPNAVDLMALRKVSNPRTLAGYERMLEVLTSAGWTLPSAWRAFLAAENLMLSGALESAMPPFTPSRDDAEGLPLVRAVAEQVTEDPSLDRAFAVGLDALIAGLSPDLSPRSGR
jgi:AcrR family transcriptional regulator